MTAAVARNSPRLPGKLTGQIGRGKGGKKAQREWGTSATDLFNKALVSNKPICKRGGGGGDLSLRVRKDAGSELTAIHTPLIKANGSYGHRISKIPSPLQAMMTSFKIHFGFISSHFDWSVNRAGHW